jgi:hypothetical protein
VAEPIDKAAAEESEAVDALSREVRRDLDNDNRPAIERHFEDLLDEMHSSQSRANDVGGPDRKERDAAERGLREFCAAIRGALDQQLGTDSLKLRHVLPEEAGIVVTAFDGLDNSWQITITWEGLERARAEFGDGPRLLSAIAGRALFELRDARHRWWRGRMPRRQSRRAS